MPSTSLYEPRVDDVGQWANELQALQARVAPRFERAEPRRRALAYLHGLLSDAERKNGWQLAEEAGAGTPDGMQRLLNASRWDVDAVRDDLVAYVREHLADPAAILVIDETGFLKKGAKSAGVQRQSSGTAGRRENCQIGVFVTSSSLVPAQTQVLVDRELYVPQDWAEDWPRRREAGVPDDVGFATKPELAQRLLERVRAAGRPAAWVTACTGAVDRSAPGSKRSASPTSWPSPRMMGWTCPTARRPCTSRPRRSPSRPAIRTTGAASRRAMAPRGHPSTTGLSCGWRLPAPLGSSRRCSFVARLMRLMTPRSLATTLP